MRLATTLLPEAEDSQGAINCARSQWHFYVTSSIATLRTGYFTEINGVLPSFNGWGETPKYAWGSMLNPKSSREGAILTSPNGLVLVPDVILARLQNKAQVAALLSFAITSVMQKQAYRAWPELMSPQAQGRVGIQGEGFPDAFGLWQDEQQVRLGIRRMYLASYDIRQAPYVWALASGKAAANPLFGSPHPEKDIPWYAAYAFNYISQYYSDVDYGKLKTGKAEYQQFLDELRKADPEAFEKK